jgi:hypothetical protein
MCSYKPGVIWTDILREYRREIRMPEEHTGPFLQMAVLCQAVLQEGQGQLSLIRITDSIGLAGPFKEMQPQTIMLYMVVTFRAGFAHGKYRVKVVCTKPVSKNEVLLDERSPYLEGEDRGVNLVFVLNLLLDEEGVFWFEVLLEDTFVTRVPLRVTYQQVTLPPQFRPPE